MPTNKARTTPGAVLHLNLKGIYFDQIKAGSKTYEYRLADKWERRLAGREFVAIQIKRGYPKAGDTERIISLPWKGYEIQTITHAHFGEEPVRVCAIRVSSGSPVLGLE